MKIHHIGYIVDKIEKAAKEFKALGYVMRGETVLDEERGIFILFAENDGLVVELISPVNETSPLYGLYKQYKNSPYHICYETTNLDEQIALLTQSGYVLFQQPKPAPAIEGCPLVAFLISRHIGIIELMETKANGN